jgi:predicted HTH transcriptional regulator
MLEQNYILKLVEKGEGLNLDFKFAVNDSKKIARSLSAFANTDGGILLIGVKDNGVIIGVKSDEEFYMVQAAAQLHTNPEVVFESKQHNVGGKSVLEIIVEKSDNKPHKAPDLNGNMKAYVRVNDENKIANSIQYKIWLNEKNKSGIKIFYTDTEKYLLDYLSKNRFITLKEFQKSAKISHFKAEKIIVNFIILNILEINFEEKLVRFKLKK